MAHWRMGAVCRALAIVVLTGTPRLAESQVATDVIRGRVTDPEKHAIAGADVKVTSYAGQVTKTATTDKNGRFTILFINGEGDYWIDVRRLGFQPKHFEVKKIGDEEIMIADAQLSSSIVTLDAVNVQEQRTRALPDRKSGEPDVGGGARPLTSTGVAPDQEGNLAAMAAAAGFQLVPGLNGAPDMYSVLGLSGDQNNVTFNGLGSGISALPPDVLVTTSINPYPFDVSKGGFSGAQISIQTIPGSNFSRRAITNASVAPALEWPDQTAAAQRDRYTSMRVGGNAAGPVKLDEIFYNSAYNVAWRSKDALSLVDADPRGLVAAGIAPDSVARLLNVLNTRRVPLAAGSAPRAQDQTVAQGIVNLDVMPSASGTGHSFTFGATGDVRRTRPVDRSNLLLATPGHADATSFWGLNGSIVHMNYFWFGVLSKTTLGIAAQGSEVDRYTQLPEGVVRVSSSLPDGGASVRALRFGGNALAASTSSRTEEASNQLSWFSLDNRHTIRLTSSLAHDAFRSTQGQDLLGSFQFNSLADLEANAPASFTRTLTAADQSGGQLAGAVALGDYWRPTPDVQVQFGVRADGNRFLMEPAGNPAVQATFGARNDVLPSRLYPSARVGLQWAFGKTSQIAYAPGAARPPRAIVHAGIGIFQNMAASTFVAPVLSATGLRSSTQSVTCVGAAVPFPAWDAFLSDPASIPRSCADGTGGTIYATGAPVVTMFDRGFRQPKALRGAIDWSGPILDNRFALGVQGIVSNGLNQMGGIDLNVRRSPSFSLADEADRPVYADPSAIVPGTGAIAGGAGRQSPSFTRVWQLRSDLAVRSHQLNVNVKPVTASARLKWDVTYSFLDVHEQFYGFSSTTSDPFAISSGLQPQTPRHTFIIQWTDFPIFDAVYVTAVMRAASGERFTPMIAADVNGDGALNDRAFIFDPSDPAHANDATTAAMRSLLSTTTPSVRRCLTRQIGQLAARASCAAPWTVANALQLKFNPAKIGLPRRATLQLSIVNPLGIADMALHGAAHTHGWGQQIPPDENLLFVRAFDPATHRYTYDVNQRFGSTRPRESVTHTVPFLSLAVTVDVGVPRERQVLTQRLDAGRTRPGTRATTETLKNFATSVIPNPMAMVLTQQTELKLTRTQSDSLATLSYRFSVFADSVWTPVASYFDALPEEYSRGEAYARYVSARQRTVDFLITLVPQAIDILTPSQRRALPAQIANFLDLRVLRFLRSAAS